MSPRLIHAVTLYVPTVFFVTVCILLYVWPTPIKYLEHLIAGHGALSHAIFVLLLVIATVFMPVTVMPIIPMVAPIFGPLTTGFLSILGWTIGAAIAFGIARVLGRPVLEQFISFRVLDEAVERIPPEARFFTIILLRMTLPVDIMSYALGLSRGVRFVPYIIATTIGVAWFSFAFAFLGAGFFSHDAVLIGAVAVSSAVLFCICWAILIRRTRTSSGTSKK